MAANKDLTPYGLQLYLYLASNMDGYEFGLSPEHAKEAAGISRTTFYEYLKLLEIKGYLVWRRGNVLIFIRRPVQRTSVHIPNSAMQRSNLLMRVLLADVRLKDNLLSNRSQDGLSVRTQDAQSTQRSKLFAQEYRNK